MTAAAILKQSGIYAIRNTVNGKLYVGSSVNFKQRKSLHYLNLRRGTHHSVKLQRAWRKYGELSFVFEVLELIENLSFLIEIEQRWIDSLNVCNVGYNVCPTAGSALGVKRTSETKRKISEANRGKKKTPEQCLQMSEWRKGKKQSLESIRKSAESRTGLKRSENCKNKISEAFQERMSRPGYVSPNLGRKLSPEHCAMISDIHRGLKHSDAAKDRISNGRRGITPVFKNPEERLAKISAANRGRVISEETRAKMVVAATGRRLSDEAKAKLSVFNKGKKLTPAHIEKITKARTGKKASAETIEKLRKSHLGKVQTREQIEKRTAHYIGIPRSDETKAKISATKKRKYAESLALLPN